ncbi:MAG: HNH endonuclease [Pseudomonadales bacterium]|nr:HNH endonuclease [Pseudomonadales bacterium]
MGRLSTVKPRVQMAQGRHMARADDVQVERWGSGRGGRPWRRKRDQIFLRDGYTCQHCGKVTHELELDHIVNVAQGGTDDDENLQSLCVPCHKQKTAMESQQARS